MSPFGIVHAFFLLLCNKLILLSIRKEVWMIKIFIRRNEQQLKTKNRWREIIITDWSMRALWSQTKSRPNWFFSSIFPPLLSISMVSLERLAAKYTQSRVQRNRTFLDFRKSFNHFKPKKQQLILGLRRRFSYICYTHKNIYHPFRFRFRTYKSV